MIISHKHRFIFIAIPKTGTHALRNALRPHLGPGDWEHVDLYHQSRLPIEAFRNIDHGHIAARDIQPHLSKGVWKDYFKFAFVRNPWDRYVSWKFFKYAKSAILQQNPRAYLKLELERENPQNQLLGKPQIEFITDSEGEVLIDYVAKWENYEEECRFIFKRIGLPIPQLQVVNQSEHKHYSHYYDDELKESIEKIYQKDIQMFGSQFEEE